LPPSTGGAGRDGAHAQARRRGARSGGPKSIHGEALGCAVPDCARPWRLSSHAWRVRPVAGGTTRCGAVRRPGAARSAQCAVQPVGGLALAPRLVRSAGARARARVLRHGRMAHPTGSWWCGLVWPGATRRGTPRRSCKRSSTGQSPTHR
jgi:hypothetical protein